MNSESSRLRSTGKISNDITAIWPAAVLIVYLAATAVVLVLGRERVPSSGIVVHLSILGAIAAATCWTHVPPWLRHWAPLLALLFLYSELPMLIQAAGHDDLFDPTVMRWERQLFGQQPALSWAARWPSVALSEALHGAYLSYYAIIFSVPGALYLGKREGEFSEAVFVLLLTFVTCFACYIVFPVAGPRYLWPSVASDVAGPVRAAAVWLLEARSSRGTAFPSSHVAVAVTQSILAFVYFGRRGWFVAVPSAVLGIGAVYGGFHYAVDVLAGVALGAVVGLLGLVTLRERGRAPRAQANATAPT